MKSTEMHDAIAAARQAANLVPFRQMSKALNLNLDVLEAIHAKLAPVLLALEGDEAERGTPPAPAPAQAPSGQVRPAAGGPVGVQFAARPAQVPALGTATFRPLADVEREKAAAAPPAGTVANEGGGLVETHPIPDESDAVATVTNEGGGLVETHSIASDANASLTSRPEDT